MGLFSAKKKGNDPFRTLSEKEIQQKLYGHLKTEERLIEELAPKQHHQESFSKSAPTIPSRSSQTTQDLFKSPSLVEAAQASSQTLQTGTLKIQTEKKSPLAFKEAEVPKGATRVVTPVVPKGPGFGERVQKNFIPAAAAFFKLFISKSIELTGILVSGIIKLSSAVDFRKPVVRRIFSWLAGAAVLIGIFAAINSLNIKREFAMKEARIQTPAASKEKASKKDDVSKPIPAKAEKTRTVNGTATKETQQVVATKSQAKSAPATEATIQATEGASPAAAEGNFVVQIATFASKTDADNLASKLRQNSFKTFVRSLTRPGGRVYQCVFLGRFATSEEAEAKLVEFRKHESAKPFQDAFVRSL